MVRREVQKTSEPQTLETDTLSSQQSASPTATVRSSDDSGFEDFPVIDQQYTTASGLSLVRRK